MGPIVVEAVWLSIHVQDKQEEGFFSVERVLLLAHVLNCVRFPFS